jgi:polyisoprenoid-binding protein YceI
VSARFGSIKNVDRIGPGSYEERNEMSAEVWLVDVRRSEISFTLRHLIVAQISGHVRRWQAVLRIDPESPALSSVEAVLDASSIDTGEVERDDHIRSAEFLNVARFPQILFRSQGITHVAGNRYRVGGDLTLRNTTREVTLEMEDLGRRTGDDGRAIAGFRAHAEINRQEFGLHWNQDLDTGGIVLGDKVEIRIAIEAVRDHGAPALGGQ